MSLYITTDRLIITEFTPDMAESVHLNSLDEDNRIFIPDEVFETVGDALNTITELMTLYDRMDAPLVYPILLKTGEQIGHVQAVPIPNDWEIGYHIGKSHTCNGYATEAVTAFLPYIMEKLGITEIAGICRADNYASRRVLEKCGFRLEFDSLATAPPQKKLYHGELNDIRVYRYVAEQITYSDKLCDVSADDLKGFFVGWRSPLTSEQHYDILRGSTHFAVALNSDGRVVGFITALCDGVNSAFIPLLEVLPEYQHRGIGSKLLRLMLTKLDGIPSIDLTCDPEMQPFYERFKMLRSTGMILRKYLD